MKITDTKLAFQNTSTLWLLFSMGLIALFFFNANGGLSNGLRSQAPDGQFLYLLSKSVGLTALLMLWWQLFSALISSCGFSTKMRLPIFKPGKTTHVVFGSMLALFIVSHAGLFISAVSLRQDSLAIHLLVPDFSGFYHAALSLGVIAFFLILAAVFVAATRKYIQRFWSYGHRLVLLAFGLAAFHAILIGSEAGSGILMYLIILLVSSIVVMAFANIWRAFDKG